jgi:hypothetical protein
MPVLWRITSENGQPQKSTWADSDGRTVLTGSGAILPGPHFRGAEDLPDQWAPGGLWAPLYAGAWAHALIGFAYASDAFKQAKEAGQEEPRIALDCSLAQLARLEGRNVPFRENAMRPDIWNLSSRETWEIKTSRGLPDAIREMNQYIKHMAPRTEHVRRGISHIEGRSPLPGRPGQRAEIVYDMREIGTVRYWVNWHARI